MSEVKYYYQHDNIDGEDWFSITPKEHFDREGTLLDDAIGDMDEDGNYIDLPEGFHEASDSTFEFDGNVEVGLKLLADSPLFEQKKMFDEADNG